MSNDRFDNANDNDDIVERALDALHRERVPHGPSSELAGRTLEALERRASAAAKWDTNERTNLLMRMMTMTLTQRIAAAVLVTVGAVVLWFMFTLLGGGSVSYAQVAKQIRDAQSMTFKLTMTAPQLPQSVEAKVYALEPGKMRNEGPGGVVTISRRVDDEIRVLSLMPHDKQARLIRSKLSDPKQAMQPDFVGEFRKLADKPGAEPLEERQIGDVKAKGFRVRMDGQVVSLWAHPKTALPLIVEMDVQAAGEGTKVIMSDIAFDVALDESLFSLEPPKDYVLKEHELAVSMDLEANLINLLQVYTASSDGAFPEKFDDWGAYAKAVSAKVKGEIDPATLQKVSGVGAVTALLSGKKAGEDYGYTGKGARLNEADRIVFWHRDKAKGTYRAIFADLTAKDVPAERVSERASGKEPLTKKGE